MDLKFDNKIKQLTDELNNVTNETIKNKISTCKTQLQTLYRVYQQYTIQIELVPNNYSNLNDRLSLKLEKTKEKLNKIDDEKYKILIKSDISTLEAMTSTYQFISSSINLSNLIIEFIIKELILNLDRKTYNAEIFNNILSHLGNIAMRQITILNMNDLKTLINSDMKGLIKDRNITADEQLNYYDNLTMNISRCISLIISDVKSNSEQIKQLAEVYKIGLK